MSSAPAAAAIPSERPGHQQRPSSNGKTNTPASSTRSPEGKNPQSCGLFTPVRKRLPALDYLALKNDPRFPTRR